MFCNEREAHAHVRVAVDVLARVDVDGEPRVQVGELESRLALPAEDGDARPPPARRPSGSG